jgi:hypothetical protein
VGFVVDKATLGQDFSEYFDLPCHSLHLLLYTHHHPSSGADTTGQIGAKVPNGLSLTFELCPPSDILKQRKVSETGFVFILR